MRLTSFTGCELYNEPRLNGIWTFNFTGEFNQDIGSFSLQKTSEGANYKRYTGTGILRSEQHTISIMDEDGSNTITGTINRSSNTLDYIYLDGTYDGTLKGEYTSYNNYIGAGLFQATEQ